MAETGRNSVSCKLQVATLQLQICKQKTCTKSKEIAITLNSNKENTKEAKTYEIMTIKRHSIHKPKKN